MRIGELAQRTATTPKAIRLYEARGLLGRVARAGSYRHYGEADVARVLLIRQAQALGFRLAELDGLPHIDTAEGWQRMAELMSTNKRLKKRIGMIIYPYCFDAKKITEISQILSELFV